MMTAVTDPTLAAERAAIAACITRCAAAPDERGRWRPEIDCLRALYAARPNERTAAAGAAAARRIGAWLAGVRP